MGGPGASGKKNRTPKRNKQFQQSGQGVLDMMSAAQAAPSSSHASHASHASYAPAALAPQAQTFSFNGAASIESTIRQAIATLDAAPLVAFFNNRGDSILLLYRETGSPNGEIIRQRYEQEWCADVHAAHRKLAHLIAGFTIANVDVTKGQHSSAHAHMLTAMRDLNQYLGDCNVDNCAKPAWMIPILGPVFNCARRIALGCEHAEASKKGAKMDEIASLFQTSLNRLVTDRTTNLMESKKQGLLVVCNHLCKAGFYTNNMGILTPTLQLLTKEFARVKAASKISLLEASPCAQRTTHLFYSGRAAMLDQRFTDAEQSLSEAFQSCHIQYRKNQVRILVFLITVKLVMGKFPSELLLRTYGLSSVFQPLMDSIKLGRVADFDKCMEANASFFAKLGIYVLLHRARMHCYLTVVRRLHHAATLVAPGDDKYQTRIKLSTLVKAFSIMNDNAEVDKDEVECALVCLMANQHVMGYISRAHETAVLRKNGPFPKYQTGQ